MPTKEFNAFAGLGPPEAVRSRATAKARLSAASTPSPGDLRRSGDSDPAGPGRSWVPPVPCGVSTPFGHSSGRAFDGRRRRDPPCAFLPLQRSIAGVLRCPADRSFPRGTGLLAEPKSAHRTALPLLDFLALRHTRGTADPISMTADPSAASWRVRGLATPFAPSTTVPTGARSAGAPLGFTLQGLAPHRGGTPFGASALLTFRASSPRPLARCEEGRRRLQGVLLAMKRPTPTP
jgi:hypothetical protein